MKTAPAAWMAGRLCSCTAHHAGLSGSPPRARWAGLQRVRGHACDAVAAAVGTQLTQRAMLAMPCPLLWACGSCKEPWTAATQLQPPPATSPRAVRCSQLGMRDPMPRLAAATRSFCSRSRSRRSALPLLPVVRRILQEGAQVLSAFRSIADERLPLLPVVHSILQVVQGQGALASHLGEVAQSCQSKACPCTSQAFPRCAMQQGERGPSMHSACCVALELARPVVSQPSHTCWHPRC